MQQHASTYSVLTHTLDTCGVVKGQTFLSESSYVANQIKGNVAKSSMQAHILSLHTPSTPWWEILLKVVMLHIILKGVEPRAPCTLIFCPYTQPRLPDGRIKHFLFPTKSEGFCFGVIRASIHRSYCLPSVRQHCLSLWNHISFTNYWSDLMHF